MITGEHRDHPRFLCDLELRGNKLAAVGVLQENGRTPIRGRIENISEGGLCVLSKRAIPVAAVVRCEIGVSGTKATIPTLTRVRWTHKIPENGGYKIGLEVLL